MSEESRSGLLNFTLFVLCVVVFFCSPHQNYSRLQGWHLFSWWSYVTTLGVLCFWNVAVLKRQGLPRFSDTKNLLLLILSISLPALVLRLMYINELSIWVDEYVQVANMSSPFIESAVQQQPPFVYQLTTGMVKVFGHTEFWLRISSVIFGTLIVLAAGVFGALLNWKYHVNAAWMILLAVTPVLVRYSFEGRPNIAGVFVGLVWASAVVWAISKDRADKNDFFRITSATFLFCSTIGMQSLALPLYSLPILLVHQKIYGGNHWKTTVLSQLLGLLMFFPVLVGIVIESAKRRQFQELESWIQRLLDSSNFIWIENGLNVFKMIPHFTLLIVIMVFVLLFLWLKKRNLRQNMAFHFLFVSVLLLPFVYALIFQVTINWNFYERYFLCYVAVFLGLFCLLLNNVWEHPFIFKVIPPAPVVAMLSFFVTAGLSWYSYARLNVEQIYRYGADIRQVYRVVNEAPHGNTLLAQFTVDMSSYWEPRSMVAPEFYLMQTEGAGVDYRPYYYEKAEDGDQVKYIADSLFEESYDTVYLIMGPFRLINDQDFLDPDGLTGVTKIDFDGYKMLQFKAVPGKQSLVEGMIAYFEKWKNSSNEWSDSFKVREMLFYLYVHSGQLKLADEVYSWLMSFDGDHHNQDLLKAKRLTLTRVHEDLNAK